MARENESNGGRTEKDVDTSLGVCATSQGNKKPKKKCNFLRSFPSPKGGKDDKQINLSFFSRGEEIIGRAFPPRGRRVRPPTQDLDAES